MKIAIFQFSLFGINTYVVYDEISKECIVIDPGMVSKEEETALTNFIEENNLKITNIINTHLHLDHAAGNNYLKLKYQVPVSAHAGDEFLGGMLQNQAKMFGLPLQIDGVEISQYLKEGDIIKLGNEVLKVIEVPGHSKGSIALYSEKDNFIIVGDALFEGSIGRTDLPGGDYNELITSIKNKLLTLPPDTVVYSGHGSPTSIGKEKISNPFLI